MSLHHWKYVLLPKCCASTHGNIHTEGGYKLTRIRFLENSSYYKQMHLSGSCIVGLLFEDTLPSPESCLTAPECLLPFVSGSERGWSPVSICRRWDGRFVSSRGWAVHLVPGFNICRLRDVEITHEHQTGAKQSILDFLWVNIELSSLPLFL